MKRIARFLNALIVSMAIGSLLFGSTAGCIDEYDDAAVLDEDEVGTLTQEIKFNALNYTCAQSLSLRWSPGGAVKCQPISKYTTVYAYWPPSGAWADIFVWNGWCAGLRGWALKDYISRACD